jgi:hypothetical protein
MNLNFVKSCIAAMALLVSASVSAATDTYGTLLSGTFQPAESFATLSYTNTGNVYDFTLSAFDLDAIFTDGAFIGAIAVDSDFQPVISNVVGDTVVSVANGGGPGGGFDFRFDLTGPQQARLTANETVSFTATFSDPVVLSASSFALHVQGLTDAQGGSAWYSPTPAVPEPETYAMLLAGLGLVGFIGRRRMSNS